MESHALRSKEAALLLQSRVSSLCTGCSVSYTVGQLPVSCQCPEMAAGQELAWHPEGVTQGGLIMHTLIKAADFPTVLACARSILEQAGCRQGTRDLKLDSSMVAIHQLATHETVSGNKPQIQSAWLLFGSLSICTKNFHSDVLGISWICLFQLCS